MRGNMIWSIGVPQICSFPIFVETIEIFDIEMLPLHESESDGDTFGQIPGTWTNQTEIELK